jgi:hypothetical protein
MRRVRIVLGLAVAVCALGALAGPAFAKEKLVFGHFVASIAGGTISPTSPAAVIENKEDEAEVTGLQLGQFKFGVLNSDNKPDYEEPCEKAPKVTGKVTEEVSESLLTEVHFMRCISSIADDGTVSWKASNIKLAIRFKSNESAEIGNTEGGFEIVKSASVLVKGAGTCLVEVPQQFVPAKAGEKEEKLWEAAEYTPEKEEPVENWEKSKKLKEQYPGDFKNRLEIETTEKFKGIVSFVDTATTTKGHGCVPVKGEENGRLITEEGPHKGWLEYTNGRIFLAAEGLEIKGGQLTFEPPA